MAKHLMIGQASVLVSFSSERQISVSGASRGLKLYEINIIVFQKNMYSMILVIE